MRRLHLEEHTGISPVKHLMKSQGLRTVPRAVLANTAFVLENTASPERT